MAYVGHFDAGAKVGALGDSIRQFGQDIQGIKDKAHQREMQIAQMDQLRASTEGLRKATEISINQDKRAAEEQAYKVKRRGEVDPISDSILRSELQEVKGRIASNGIKTLSDLVTLQSTIVENPHVSVEDAKSIVEIAKASVRENLPDLVRQTEKIGIGLGDPAAFEEMFITNRKVALRVSQIAIAENIMSFCIGEFEKTPEGSKAYADLLRAYNTANLDKARLYKDLGKIYDAKMGRLEERESLLGEAASKEALKEATVSKLKGYYGDELVVNKAEILEGTKEPPPVKIHDDTMNMFRDVKSKAPPEETTAKQRALGRQGLGFRGSPARMVGTKALESFIGAEETVTGTTSSAAGEAGRKVLKALGSPFRTIDIAKLLRFFDTPEGRAAAKVLTKPRKGRY